MAELDELMRQSKTFFEMSKVYALIWEKCAKAMKNKHLQDWTTKQQYTTSD
jgi:hypothetical protein